MIARWKRLDRPTLIAIGKRLRAQYEAEVAAPMSAELVAAVAKLKTMLREKTNSGTVLRLPRKGELGRKASRCSLIRNQKPLGA
jgi:hypothetical protein